MGLGRDDRARRQGTGGKIENRPQSREYFSIFKSRLLRDSRSHEYSLNVVTSAIAGVSPSGKARAFGACIGGSNPPTPAIRLAALREPQGKPLACTERVKRVEVLMASASRIILALRWPGGENGDDD